MERLAVVQKKLARQGELGPVVRLMPTTTATTLRKEQTPPLGGGRSIRRDQGAAARLLRRELRISRRRCTTSLDSSPRSIRGAPTRSGLWPCSTRTVTAP